MFRWCLKSKASSTLFEENWASILLFNAGLQMFTSLISLKRAVRYKQNCCICTLLKLIQRNMEAEIVQVPELDYVV